MTLASLCHDHAFGTGLYVPYCHLKGPFSWMKPTERINIVGVMVEMIRIPSREEHPGPPLNQMTTSSLPAGLTVGKNQ